MLTRLNDAVTRAFLYLAAFLAFGLCFLVVADVLGRVVFNAPVKGTPEIVSTSIVIICFLQAGYAIRSGGMLHVDALLKRAPPHAAIVADGDRRAARRRLLRVSVLGQHRPRHPRLGLE